MIHYFPLEPSDERWTGFMDRVISDHLGPLKERAIRYGLPLNGVAPLGPSAFYDAAAVTEYRSGQLREFAEAIRMGIGGDGDMVFFTDLLVPGVEAVAYMLHLSGIEMQIRGLVHAGSFTDHDMLNPVERWAAQHENAVFDIADRVYLGSDWIRTDILQKRLVDPGKLIVTGFPLDPNLPEPKEQRDPIVVFNGRLSPEKQPQLFEKIKPELWRRMGQLGVSFINCAEAQLSKPVYYSLLSRSKVVISFALQETFGTAVQEAVKLGCIPVVPNACCYPEQFAEEYRYDTLDEAIEKVWQALTGKLTVPTTTDCSDAVERWFA